MSDNCRKHIGIATLYFATFLATFMIISCSRVPNHILSEKKMRAVLYDMQIAEAMIETDHESYPTSAERRTLYDAVFAKHRITQAEYDSTLVWYGQHMDLYMQIYKLVLKDMEASTVEAGDIKFNPLSVEASAKDSIDIWINKNSYTFKPERAINALIFDIKPEQPYSAGSSFVLGLSAWGISSDWLHKPKICIRAIQADTTISIRREIPSDGYFETTVMTVADKPVKSVCGYIVLNEADIRYRRVYIDNISLMKYNYGSNALTAPKAQAADSIPTMQVQNE